MDATRQLATQDLNPTTIDRIAHHGSFEDVRRALRKWETKTFSDRPKYGHGKPLFLKSSEGAPQIAKGPLTPSERKARRMARIKRHWDKLPIEEKQRRRAIINERNRANRAKKKGTE
jgi:hypothetical protein